MEPKIDAAMNQTVIDETKTKLAPAGLLHSLVEAVQPSNLESKSTESILAASATIPEPGTKPAVSFADMLKTLRQASGSHDEVDVKKFASVDLPAMPSALVEEAFKKPEPHRSLRISTKEN